MTIRIDPRRPFIVTARGLRRIILGSTEGERDLRRLGGGHETVRKLRLAGDAIGSVLVVAHSERGGFDEHAREAIAAAALLARPDEQVVLLSPSDDGECPSECASLGVDLLESMQLPEKLLSSVLADKVAAICTALQPRLVVLPDRDADGEIGRRIAAKLGWPAACDVVEVSGERVRVRYHGDDKRAGGDATLGLEQVRLLLVARQVAKTELPFIGQGKIVAATLTAPGPDVGVRVLETSSGKAQQVALEEAEFIVAAGNGVQDVNLFRELASALGAAVGASRVAVDDGRFPRTHQIGATGKTVQARGYLAIGISGAVQHLQGIKECRHVIAVNTDTSAPIAQRSELFVAEDAQDLMKAMLKLIRQSVVGKETVQ